MEKNPPYLPPVTVPTNGEHVTSCVEWPGRSKCIHTLVLSLGFWGLAVIVLVNLHYTSLWETPGVRLTGLSAILGLCLLLLGLSAPRSLKEQGTLTLGISVTIAFYLVIGILASFATPGERQPEFGRDILRQVFFFLVLLAVALGGRSLLERIGIEVLIKGVLAILTASCFVILASPVLRDLGVLSVFRLKYRLTGAFTHPNDAGFIGCMTVTLALAWFCHSGRRNLSAYWGLTVGVATVFGSVSWTACVVLAAIWFLYLLQSGIGIRHLVFLWGGAVGVIGIFVYLTAEMKNVSSSAEFKIGVDSDLRCSAVRPDNLGLIHDCAILLTTRDGLAGAAPLNWSDSLPIASWRGVKVRDVPARVVSLDLRRIGLNGHVPPDLAELDHLETLRLDHNQLTGPIPPSLGRLPNLRVLGLSFNALTGPIPPELGSLSKLEELLLRGNDLTEGVPAELATLDNLWRWDLGDANGFGPLDVLRKIDNADILIRVHQWKVGLDRFLESPLLGTGIGQLRYNVGGSPLSNEGQLPGVHNVYLMLGGEAGIIPLSLYVFFIFSALRLGWTAPKSLARDVVVSWVFVMGIYGLTFHHLLTLGAFMWCTGLCCAIAAASGIDRTGQSRARFRTRSRATSKTPPSHPKGQD